MSPLSPTFPPPASRQLPLPPPPPGPSSTAATVDSASSSPSPASTPPLPPPTIFTTGDEKATTPLMDQSPLEGMSGSNRSLGGGVMMGDGGRTRVPSLGMSGRRKPPPADLVLQDKRVEQRREQPKISPPSMTTSPSLPSSAPPASFTSSSSSSAPIAPTPSTHQTPQRKSSVSRSASQQFNTTSYYPPSTAAAVSAGNPSSSYPSSERRASGSDPAPIPQSGSQNYLASPLFNLPTPNVAFPTTPEPSTIDRRTLVGVGELATPRWTAGQQPGGIGGSSWDRAWASPDESELAYASGGGEGGWGRAGESNRERERSGGSAGSGLENTSSARRMRASVPLGLSSHSTAHDGLGLGILNVQEEGGSQHHASSTFSTSSSSSSRTELPPKDRPRVRLVTYSNSGPPPPPPRSNSYNTLANDDSRPPTLSTNKATSSSSDSPVLETPPPVIPSPSLDAAGGYLLQITPPIATSSSTFFDRTPPQQQQQGSSPLINHRKRSSGQFSSAVEELQPEGISTESERRKQRGLVVSLPLSASSRPSPSESSSPASAASTKARELRRTPPSSSYGLAGIASGGGEKERSSNATKSPSQPSSPRPDIVRHFSSSHDFSHLPPSPSSSSIHQFFVRNNSSTASPGGASGGPNNIPSSSSSYFQPPSHQAPLPPSASNTISTSNPTTPLEAPAATNNPSPHHSRSQSQHTTSSAHNTPQKSSSHHHHSSPSFLSSPHLSLDPETAEALRKLDGLGRSPSGGEKRHSQRSSKTRASLGSAGSGSMRSGSPPPALPSSIGRTGSAGGRSSRSRSSMPAFGGGGSGGVLTNEQDGVFLVDSTAESLRSATFNPSRSSVGAASILSSKRGSSSSTSMATGSVSTAASSLPPPPRGPSSSAGASARIRNNINGSDVSSLHSEGANPDGYGGLGGAGGGGSASEGKEIPPVPPLPKGYTLSSRTSLLQLAQAAQPSSQQSTQTQAALPSTTGGAPRTPTSAGSSSSPSSIYQSTFNYPAPTLDEMQKLNEEDDRKRSLQREQQRQQQQQEEARLQEQQQQQQQSRPVTPPSKITPAVALAPPPSSTSPKSTSGKVPGKKWSFSNALHIKLPSSNKTSSSSTASSAAHPLPPSQSQSFHDPSPPLPPSNSHSNNAPPLTFPKIPDEDPASPSTPWSTIERPGSSPFFVERPSQDSRKTSDSRASISTSHSNMTTQSNSNLSATAAAPSSPKSTHSKRLTPSSIPFFRRSSSTSMKSNTGVPSPQPPPVVPPVPSTPRKNSANVPSISTPSSSHSSNEHHSYASNSGTAPLSARKSMLGGMSLQGMLKSSSSRRSLAAQANEFGGQQTGGFTSSSGGGGTLTGSPARYTGRSVSEKEEKKEREKEEKRERERVERAERVEREKERDRIAAEKEKEKGERSHGRLSSMSLLGRRRGKTISSTEKDREDMPISLPPMQMSGLPESTISRLASLTRSKGSPSKSSLPSASSSSASGSTPRRASTTVTKPHDLASRTSRSNLPTIAGSPSVAPVSGISSIAVTALPTSSFHRLTGQTPTKIPRISSRNMGAPSTPTLSQQTPSLSSRRSSVAMSTSSSSRNGMTRSTSSNLSEFGEVGDEDGATPSATTARQYRSSQNNDYSIDSTPLTRRTSTIQPSSSTGSVNTRPPRQLPVPPSSSSAALTASAAAKKVTRDTLPARKPSNMTFSASANDLARHVAPSPARTLTSKLSLPASRIPSSSSSREVPGTPISRSSSASPSVMDEDEIAADEEMRQFMKRQRSRKVASGATSSELEAMMNFPEPIDPSPCGTPLSTIKSSYTALSDFERKEIVDYPSVYYIGENSAKKASTREESSNNHGYDDERGDYLVVEHDHLAYRYEIIGLLGKGSFGQVLQCRDHCTGGSVAVKIIRNKKRFHHQALVEVKILDNLRKWDPDEKHYVIRMTEHFYFRNHLCIATELLSINLYELIKANSFAGFTTTLIRRFTVQLLQSLILMRHHRIVHCDLKPENVLLSHPSKSGIKVIDFGSSCFEHEKVYTYIQSRFYRSPEVILGANYHMAIDMWSLGCILAELYTGFPIFPGENEQEQLSCIMEVLGLPDKYLVDKSSRKNLFFDTQGAPRPVVNSKGKRRRPGTKTLAQVLKSDDDLFVDFIAKCLIWDPERRLKPQPALRHPWLVKQRARSLQSPAPSVAGRILNSASSLASPALKSRSHETPKKTALSIGAPTPLSARVRPAANNSTPASAQRGSVLDSSVSSTSSYRQRLTGHTSLTSSSSARNLSNAYGLSKPN